jgi:hypothetical protein
MKTKLSAFFVLAVMAAVFTTPGAFAQESQKASDKPAVSKEPSKKSTAPQKDDSAASQAKAMGLDYFGFGRYGKDKKVTHIVKNRRLIQKPIGG